MLEALFTLVLLILLQAVLGIDNLLYISLESKNAPVEKQAYVRSVGIGVAILLRIILLFVVVNLIRYVQAPWLILDNGIIDGVFNFHSIVVLLGGVFILYTGVKEIWHMVYLEEHAKESKNMQPTGKVIAIIVVMNLIFSFDSILSAIALTDDLWVMGIAIVASGVLMIWLSDRVSAFLQKNRIFEILGLFILMLVGVMLISDGGHLAQMKLLGNEIHAMSKANFYFILFILVAIDVVQSRYQRRLLKNKMEKIIDV